MLATEPVDEGRAKMSESKNEVIKFDVVVVGSCMTDLVSYVSRLPKAGETLHGNKFTMGFGGKGANQCIMAARLGCDTAMVAKLGKDSFGESYMKNFVDNGVDVTFVGVTDKASTGVAPITVNANGENSIVIIGGANLLLTEDDVKAAKDIITSASVLVCQLEIKPEVTQAALSIAKKAGVTTIFNPAPAQSWLDTMFYKDSDVFCANETEAEILTGVPISSIEDAFNALPVLLGRGAAKIVITLGENGSVVATREDPTPRHVPSKEVKPLDTTGAGDAFVGALAFYLSKYKGLTFVEMVRRANEIAAISVCGPGTQTSYPTVAKLPPALFDPPGVNSCPQRSPKPDTTIVHRRSKSEERSRRISLPNDNIASRDGKHRNSNESPPKGQRRSSNDDAPSSTKKTRGFFARRRSEGSVGSRKQMVEQSKSNGKVTKGDNEGGSGTKSDANGRRGSVPQIQGVALAEVETVGRETMIDF